MASAIGSGTNFFGFPVKQGKVLYIDCDSPENLLAGRLAKKPVAPNVWFQIMKPLGIPNVSKELEDELREAQKEVHPDVVFLNTLRKVHGLDDKESTTPVVVYSYFQHIFPQAALVFVHHPRKRPTDPRFKELKTENFSGSGHWIDDAQVGIYLEKYRDSKKRFNIRLIHTKAQGGALINPLCLNLDKTSGSGGVNLTSPLFEDLVKIYPMIHEMAGKTSAHKIDLAVAETLNTSESTARRLRLMIEEGGFPSRIDWMNKTEEDRERDDEDDD